MHEGRAYIYTGISTSSTIGFRSPGCRAMHEDSQHKQVLATEVCSLAYGCNQFFGQRLFQMADTALVEETEKRLRSHKGVQGLIVLNGDGIAIRSTMDNADTVKYAALVSRYVEKTRTYIKKLCSEDDLDFVRIRCSKYEVMIAPDFTVGSDYCLVVVQNPTTE